MAKGKKKKSKYDEKIKFDLSLDEIIGLSVSEVPPKEKQEEKKQSSEKEEKQEKKSK